MSEEPKVYVVTSGCYSGYGIEAVFSTRELADLYCAKMNAHRTSYYHARVEAYPLDDGEAEIRGNRTPYRVMMTKDGTVEHVRPYTGEWPTGKPWFDAEWEWGKLVGYRTLMLDVWATDAEHAVKIVNERRAQILALNEWPEVKAKGKKR